MGNIAYVASGSTPDSSEFVPQGIPYLKVYNIRNQKIDFEYKPQYITPNVHNGKLQRSRTQVGDVLMNIVGPPLGKLAIIPQSLSESNFNQAAVLIRPFLYKFILNKYLFYFLSEMSEINSISTKGSAGQVNISLTQSKNIRIPLPPLSEQQKIVSTIEQYNSLVEDLEVNKEDLQQFVAQTKSKILDLAIRGKLVPQDPNDEPASVLLERIKAEHPESKKKAKNISDNSHYPFEIPKNWVWKLLGEVNTIARGGSPRPIKDYLTEAKDGINWIKIGDTEKEGKYIFTTQERIKKDGVRYSRMVNIDDFLLTNSMSFGRPYILKTNGCIHDGWLVINTNKQLLDNDFMYYLLSSDFMYNQFFDNAVGSTVKNLKIDTVQLIHFPIPPISEQRRIVKKIEEIFASLDEITNSIKT